MKTKTFDCVEMMHRGARRVRRETEGMTEAERLQYWRQQTEALRQKQQAIRERLASEAGGQD